MKTNLIEQYYEEIKDKKIAVVGLGRSNLPLIDFLLQGKCDITGFDKASDIDLSAVISPLKEQGVNFSLGENYLNELKNFDIIFRTPGLRPDKEEFINAKKNGALITSEMEIFVRLCPAPIFAVTGSDGKTTTTTLIYKLLQEEGYNCFLGGNIGRPLIGDINKISASDIVVLELSSFQLMTMSICPDVAVITNITPNHLDWHTSYEEYIESKKNIFQFKTCEKSNLLSAIGGIPRLILNYDNPQTRLIISNAETANIIPFSRQNSLEIGTFIENNVIILKNEKRIERFVDINEILIPGSHNIENYMAAISAVSGIVKPQTVRRVAMEFSGVEHRIELVRELDGIKIYNDSIASSPSRTIAGLRSFDKKVILIAGGCDKKLSYAELGNEIIEHVKDLVLIGQTATKIRDAFEKARDETNKGLDIGIYSENTFEDGVNRALALAQTGDIVILSPASTSFDMFKNFEERGKTFKTIVMNY